MDLDDELRRLFHDDRLDIQVKSGAEQAVVTGARRVRRRRVALTSVAGAFAVAAVVAGGILLSGITAPRSLPPADSVGPTSTATSPPPPSSSGTAAAAVGYGPLKLGMSEADAMATEVLSPQPQDGADGCRSFATQGNADNVKAVVVSPKAGVVRITLPAFAKTSTGAGVGSTAAEVKARYSTTVDLGDRLQSWMPGEKSWYYVFTLDAEKKVTSIRMELDTPECPQSTS